MSQSQEIVIKTDSQAILVCLECVQMSDEHARALQSEVSLAAEQAPGLPVIVDMSKVEFLPSLGIGMLVTLLQQFKQDGRQFMLVSLQPKARETLTICRLDKLFEIYENLDEALSRIRQSS